jgi:heparinase II/III-like protein
MRLGRLLTMTLSEVAYRGRQETAKWCDRLGVTGRTERLSDATAGALLEDFCRTAPARFFDGVAHEATPRFVAQHMRESYDETVAVADAVCRRRFDLLGYRGLTFGDPVDWHLDPIAGRRGPSVHWSRLDPLDPTRVGDSKVTWELNRHQWLARLGAAYRLTGDERYAETFAEDVRAWMRANPPGIGINWSSSLEAALRLISWCWAMVFFRGSKALSPELFGEMLGGIRAHASHVERYLSYYFAPNTHLTGEALGLFYAGTVFPALRPARRWRALGARILLEQLERQVLPDGVYFEQSTCYQRYTVETYLHFMLLAARNGVALPPTVGERVQRLVDVLVALRRPDGSMPAIGDADGGWLLPLAQRAPDDFRGVFSTAAALFGRSDYAWAARGLAPETVWLLGPDGVKAFDGLRQVPPGAPASRLFAEGGLVVMRSGWDAGAHQLVFDVGPLGCPFNAGHGHADLLSIQCSVFGQPCLVDAGTYGYTAEPRWRDFFRGTTAHSTVVVDGLGQAVPAGPFKWDARPRARLQRWQSTEAVDDAEATHDAYSRLADPVVHRRRVLFVKPGYWVVVDDLDGRAEHAVELRFQFAPIEVTVGPDLWARARVSAGRGLLLKPFATASLKGDVHEGELAPIQGWISPDYGRRAPSPALTYSTVTRLPLRIVTLLLPTENVEAAPPAVTLLRDDRGAPVGVALDDNRTGVSALVDDPASRGA